MSDLLQDRYRLLRPLGSGGGGQSYLADDAQTGRRVVVKALYTPASGPPPQSTRSQADPSPTARRYRA